jgi:2-dehydro-3-deoxygalactonokinase
VVWRSKYIAVDWGNTNRRAWLLGEDGSVKADFADGLGFSSLSNPCFESLIAEIRDRLGDWPMILAGMIGSNKGWHQTDYVGCPANALSLAQNIYWVEAGRTGIIPGICQLGHHPDVMRGEEVQAIGALTTGLVARDSTMCHPGTHSKWLDIKDGNIQALRTVMTGEMFKLLHSSSILAEQMQEAKHDHKAFQQGYERIISGEPLLSALFEVRARHVLQHNPLEGRSFVSGLLIASDVQAGLLSAISSGPMYLIGQSDLCGLYKIVLEAFGRAGVILDGDATFVAGVHTITQELL